MPLAPLARPAQIRRISWPDLKLIAMTLPPVRKASEMGGVLEQIKNGEFYD